MTHKERLLTANNQEELDRVPICAWYTPEAAQKILPHVGVESPGLEQTGGADARIFNLFFDRYH